MTEMVSVPYLVRGFLLRWKGEMPLNKHHRRFCPLLSPGLSPAERTSLWNSTHRSEFLSPT